MGRSEDIFGVPGNAGRIEGDLIEAEKPWTESSSEASGWKNSRVRKVFFEVLDAT